MCCILWWYIDAVDRFTAANQYVFGPKVRINVWPRRVLEHEVDVRRRAAFWDRRSKGDLAAELEGEWIEVCVVVRKASITLCTRWEFINLVGNSRSSKCPSEISKLRAIDASRNQDLVDYVDDAVAGFYSAAIT